MWIDYKSRDYLLCSYFIQKGADVNAMGGELKSAPIHWAARYGCNAGKSVFNCDCQLITQLTAQ